MKTYTGRIKQSDGIAAFGQGRILPRAGCETGQPLIGWPCFITKMYRKTYNLTRQAGGDHTQLPGKPVQIFR
jgi:hypothetical protein